MFPGFPEWLISIAPGQLPVSFPEKKTLQSSEIPNATLMTLPREFKPIPAGDRTSKNTGKPLYTVES